MSKLNQLVDEQVRAYDSRLKSIDDLLGRARKTAAQVSTSPEMERELNELECKRDALSDHVNDLRRKRFEHWERDEILNAGPMALWDVVALEIEHLIEKLER